MLLNGAILPRSAVQELIQMQRRSFVPIVRSVTPPPSPPLPSEILEEGPWTVTAEDLLARSSRMPDYGMVFVSLCVTSLNSCDR